jgi:branched-chain amino acid transport system permease protein
MVNLGIYVFPAILIGGLDSVGGVLIGSLIFAFVSQASTTYTGSSSSDLVAALATLFILTVRPYGLFGTPEYLRL